MPQSHRQNVISALTASSENLADLPYLSCSSCHRFLWLKQTVPPTGESKNFATDKAETVSSFSSFISYDLSLLKGKKRGKYSMVFTEVNLMYVSSVMEFYIYLNNLTLQVQKLRYKKVM